MDISVVGYLGYSPGAILWFFLGDAWGRDMRLLSRGVGLIAEQQKSLKYPTDSAAVAYHKRQSQSGQKLGETMVADSYLIGFHRFRACLQVHAGNMAPLDCLDRSEVAS